MIFKTGLIAAAHITCSLNVIYMFHFEICVCVKMRKSGKFEIILHADLPGIFSNF